MLDIRWLRAKPDVVKAALAKRDSALPQAVEEILVRDEARREAIGEANELKAQRNTASKQIGELKRAGEDASDIIDQTRTLGERISELDGLIRETDAFIRRSLLLIPNAPLERVPNGSEDDNEVLSTWGTPAAFEFEPRAHWTSASATTHSHR